MEPSIPRQRDLSRMQQNKNQAFVYADDIGRENAESLQTVHKCRTRESGRSNLLENLIAVHL